MLPPRGLLLRYGHHMILGGRFAKREEPVAGRSPQVSRARCQDRLLRLLLIMVLMLLLLRVLRLKQSHVTVALVFRLVVCVNEVAILVVHVRAAGGAAVQIG